MKHFYITCLLLSSFFTYKQLYADEQYSKYAFFIPKDSLISNIDYVKEESPKQSTPSKNQNQTQSQKITEKKPPVEVDTYKNKDKNLPIKEKPKEVSFISKSKATEEPKTIEKNKSQPKKTINQPAKTPATKEKSTIENIPYEIFKNMSIDAMLAAIPYPNTRLPKYQQIYASYALDLAILYRTGALPSNFEQEKTLAKACNFRHHKFEN